MYLNDFRVEIILEVIEEIKSNEVKSNTDLVYKIEIDKNDKRKYARLIYYPEFHRIDAKYFDIENECLYPNPDYMIYVAPRYTFVKEITPNDNFKKLMNA